MTFKPFFLSMISALSFSASAQTLLWHPAQEKDLEAYVERLHDTQEEQHQKWHSEVYFEYADATGKNRVTLTEAGHYIGKTYQPEGANKTLTAARYVEGNDQPVWVIRDFVNACTTSPTLRFLYRSVAVTDLDHNGVSEVWLPYLQHCAGDISPMTMKLIMYEGTTKYALRGQTLYVDEHGRLGGTATPGERMRSAAPVFRQFGQQLWQQLIERTAVNLLQPQKRDGKAP